MTKFLRETIKIFYRCHPKELIENITYHQLTNFDQGVVVNEDSIGLHGSCWSRCEFYKAIRTTPSCLNCDCLNIYDCGFRGDILWACYYPTLKNRRYIHLDYYDQERDCDDGLKEMMMRYKRYDGAAIWCDYCLCYCDDPSPESHRVFSLQLQEANTTANEAITGVRVLKYENHFYLQIQVGKMLPFHKINQESVRWVPIEPIKSVNYENDRHDYFILKRRMRFDLDIVEVKPNQVLTG